MFYVFYKFFLIFEKGGAREILVFEAKCLERKKIDKLLNSVISTDKFVLLPSGYDCSRLLFALFLFYTHPLAGYPYL